MKTASNSPFAVQATILTGIAAAMAILLSLAFPLSLVALCFSPLVVALLLLWVASDVEAPEDRIAEVDARTASARQQRAQKAPQPMSRAA